MKNLCPECKDAIIIDKLTKTILCGNCGLVIEKNIEKSLNWTVKIEKEHEKYIKIRNILKSINIPISFIKQTEKSRVWGSENIYPFTELIRLSLMLETPLSVIERSAYLFKECIESHILSALFDLEYVESLLIACLLIANKEAGRDIRDLLIELQPYVCNNLEDMKTTVTLLEENLI